MERQPLISVIIPYYNSEKYLERCIQSITSQTYRNLEILLVNDGSEDRSAEIAENLSKDDIRIRNITVPHGGVSNARNSGLREAAGSLILFADSDDWMAPNIILRMQDLMLQTNADLVTCEIIRAEEMKIEESPSALQYDSYTREEYLRVFFKIETNEWVHFPVAKLYRKDLLPQPLYPPAIRVGEDVLGTYRAIARTRTILRLRETGYYYFTNPHSTTSSFTEKDFDLISVWDQMVQVTEGKEPDHAYAKLNRDRINFTLLFRMLTEVSGKEIRQKYRKQNMQLRADLQKCEKELLHSPIVASRKILIFLLCHCYPLAAFGGNAFVWIRKITGLKTGVSRRKLS